MKPFELPSDRIFVAGEWRQGRGAPITSVFPADGTVNRVVHGAAREDVGDAIDCAIEAGAVWISTCKQFPIAAPFGGVKDSGLGREMGRDGIRAWMAQKSIYRDLSGQLHPRAA